MAEIVDLFKFCFLNQQASQPKTQAILIVYHLKSKNSSFSSRTDLYLPKLLLQSSNLGRFALA